jgi:hypothetical protein
MLVCILPASAAEDSSSMVLYSSGKFNQLECFYVLLALNVQYGGGAQPGILYCM